MESYLLEKPRVTALADTDSNFHVFYYLVAGAEGDLRRRLELGERSFSDFQYLRPGNADAASATGRPNPALASSAMQRDVARDSKEFAALRDALRTCNVSDSEQQNLLSVLAAILHLGNTDFVFVKNLKRHAPRNRPTLGAVARLLQIDPQTLEKSLTTRMVGAGSRDSLYSVPLEAAGVQDARDSLAKLLYNAMFNWLVERINEMLASTRKTDGDRFVAILDIFGFENFAHNSFEQLLVNNFFFFCFVFFFLFFFFFVFFCLFVSLLFGLFCLCFYFLLKASAVVVVVVVFRFYFVLYRSIMQTKNCTTHFSSLCFVMNSGHTRAKAFSGTL